jgi:glycine oxidase
VDRLSVARERRRAPDVVVVGGGVIGLSVAWRAAARGMAVTVVDPHPCRGASWVAAGMLAPVTEVHYGEEALLHANLAASAAWPAFAGALEAATGGSPVGYRRSGTLLVAFDEGDRAVLADLHSFHEELGLRSRWLSARAARDLEPALAPGVRAGVWAPGDHQVDNRRLLAALTAGGAAAGVATVERAVVALRVEAGAVQGVTLDDGEDIDARAVVLAAGHRSGAVVGLGTTATPPVRPVKGQILRLRGSTTSPLLRQAVRGIVNGSPIYLVPRADGTVVVGATMEERGEDVSVTAGAVYEMLRDAHRVAPGVTELLLEESSAALRPGSPDNAPIVGPVGDAGPRGLVLATGHHRNGILLAPLTADAVVAHLSPAAAGEEGVRRAAEALAPFGPQRFHTDDSRVLDAPGATARVPHRSGVTH